MVTTEGKTLKDIIKEVRKMEKNCKLDDYLVYKINVKEDYNYDNNCIIQITGDTLYFTLKCINCIKQDYEIMKIKNFGPEDGLEKILEKAIEILLFNCGY